MSGKSALAVLCILSLTTGCTTVDPVTAAYQDHDQCLSAGHKEGSSGLANCRIALSENRKARQAQTNAALGQAALVGAAVVGGAALVAASQPRTTYVYPHRYYHCDVWGRCWWY